jgi:hypothetical protein
MEFIEILVKFSVSISHHIGMEFLYQMVEWKISLPAEGVQAANWQGRTYEEYLFMQMAPQAWPCYLHTLGTKN